MAYNNKNCFVQYLGRTLCNKEFIQYFTYILIFIIDIQRMSSYQFEDPSPTIPTHRQKEEKVKTVEDKKGGYS